jgi:hypothetical protein
MAYHTEKSCVNKLFGFCFGFGVHKNSARFGWTYNKETNKIDIWCYFYNDGKLTKKSVFEFADDIDLEFDELALPTGEMDFTKKEEDEEGTEEFITEMLEENNYLVLFFDNSIDWLQVETLFGIKKVKYQLGSFAEKQNGVCRIINGTKFIKKMLESENK